MSDPVLEYLKSVKQDLRDIKADMSTVIQKHDERLDSLEDAHAEQRGMVKMAGIVVTGASGLLAASGFVAFIVTHFKG